MLSVLFFLICYGTSILLFLGGVANTANPSDLEFPVFLPCAIADIVLIIVFIVIENKFFKMKINVPLIIILSCLFIVNLVVIATTPLENSVDFIYTNPSTVVVVITNEYKVIYILAFFLLLLNIYISICYAVYRLEFRKQFAWICSLIVLAGASFVLYSYIAEWETYKLFFANITTDIKDYSPQSFTGHPNSYAAILLGSGFACFGLHVVTKKRLFLFLSIFFCTNIIFPFSRICLLLALIFLLLVFIYKMIVSWKEHFRRNINIIVVVTFLLTLLILVACNDTTIRNYIEHVVLSDNYTFKSRSLLWECALSIVKEFHSYIGVGHGYFNTVFAYCNIEHVKMPHNLYIQTYCSLGFLGVAFLAILICFIIYKIIKLFKNNRDAAFVSVIGLIVVMLYYLGEG